MKIHANGAQAAALLAVCLSVLIFGRGSAAGQNNTGPTGRAAPGDADSSSAPAVDVWRPIGRLDHEPIKECSGIVASRQYPGIFWVHSDSGHPPVLYAVTETGELVAEVRVEGATNADWEDIATDDAGHLYVGDIGNNYGLFPMRTVYRSEEPDPRASPVKPAKVIDKVRYGFEADRFNAEGLYFRDGEILVVPRSRSAKTAVYRLTAADGGKYLPVQVAQLPIGSITGADISADGQRLAACTPWALYVFPLDADGRPITDRRPQVARFPRSGIEACCFDGDDVILASEHRNIYRITAAQLAAGTRFAKPPPGADPSASK